MLEKKKRVLTSKDRDRIVREIVANPNISREELNKVTGIIPQHQEEKILIPWIEKYSHLVFREKIYWSIKKFRSLRDTPITPDLIGKDCNGCPVIVEVKLKFNIPAKNNPRTDREHKSVGQILQYVCTYMRNYPLTQQLRLFIVCIDFSPDVDAVCKFLHSKGIDIEHIAIENILAEKEVSP